MTDRITLFLFALASIFLTACRSSAPALDYRELAKASVVLGIDIGIDDNHALYIESARWIGTPYRLGGEDLRGVDCSGLTSQLYRKVFRTSLKRNSEEQRRHNCRKIAKGSLREGDLIFFHNGKQRKKASHVGLYLKNGQFIHASSRGVVVNNINETYYRRHWLSAGRVKR